MSFVQRNTLVVVRASLLGAAVLMCAQPARAQGPQKPPSAPVTVVNTNANPVPVTVENPLAVSGSVSITGVVAVQQSGEWNVATADARTPTRFGPFDVFGSDKVLVPVVPAGRTFVVSHFEVVGFSNISSVAPTGGLCFLRLTSPPVNSPFGGIPLQVNSEILMASQSVYIVLNAGESLSGSCFMTPTTTLAGFHVNVSGYFVAAPTS